MLSAVSCLKTEEILFQDTTMGFVLADGRFDADDGLIFTFPLGTGAGDQWVAGTRFLITCNAKKQVSGSTTEFEADMVNLVKPMYHDALYKSKVTDWDKVGNDEVDVQTAWISANSGYLNMRNCVHYSGSADLTHTFDLIYDDSRVSDDTVFLELRHNADGDEGEELGYLYTSFPIREFIPSGSSEVKVVLSWSWAGAQSQTITITR